jgi:hypothetical protein
MAGRPQAIECRTGIEATARVEHDGTRGEHRRAELSQGRRELLIPHRDEHDGGRRQLRG